MADLSASIAGVRLRNPTILASGILGVTASSLVRVAESGAGAVTSKSVGPEQRMGHSPPVMVEVESGLLNAVGLSCPPLEESLKELKSAKKRLKTPLIVSFYGRTEKEFGEVAEALSEIKPALLEANISCPNVASAFGRPFGSDPKTAAAVTRQIKKKTDVPVIVKLTPNVVDIVEVAKAVEKAGADAINAINTAGPGMSINLEARRPVLSNLYGGLSGSAIKPLAVRCIYQIYDAVDVPIVGTGGVASGRDAVELMMAGASAVGVGTAVMWRDTKVFSSICSEMQSFMKKEGVSKLREIIGAAHRK